MRYGMRPEKDTAVALLLAFVAKITTFESPSIMYRPRLREENRNLYFYPAAWNYEQPVYIFFFCHCQRMYFINASIISLHASRFGNG